MIEVPTAGGMASRCEAYLSKEKSGADIIIRAELYKPERYTRLDENGVAYMESGFQFYRQLISFGGIMLHASAVELGGRAYLFSASSGTGKSTHTRLWQEVFGEAAQVFNDDKPALRRLDGKWFAYGTPWCGKDGINQNKKVPLAGICFLKRGDENSMRRVSNKEAIALIMTQTLKRFKDPENLRKLLGHLDKLVREIPIYELTCLPEPEAATLSHAEMLSGAEQAGL